MAWQNQWIDDQIIQQERAIAVLQEKLKIEVARLDTFRLVKENMTSPSNVIQRTWISWSNVQQEVTLWKSPTEMETMIVDFFKKKWWTARASEVSAIVDKWNKRSRDAIFNALRRLENRKTLCVEVEYADGIERKRDRLYRLI